VGWLCVGEGMGLTDGHEKRVNALTQPFVNLKSNTMKNTR